MSEKPIYIDMNGGVSHRTGEAFVAVKIREGGPDGRVIGRGQMSPTELRTHALYCLEVAESAEQDAATLAAMQEMLGEERGLQLGGMVVQTLRTRRDPR